MDDKDTDLFSVIGELKPVAPETIADFKRTMTNEVIPEIVRVVEERRVLAAASRDRQLKC